VVVRDKKINYELIFGDEKRMQTPLKTPVLYSYEFLHQMDLEESLRIRLGIEFLHLLNLIPNEVYYTKYHDNAELFERDYAIYLEQQE
jgi:hypothetical protein